MRKSMDTFIKWMVPMLYPDTPTFLGLPKAETAKDLAGVDLAIIGVPYESPPTMGRESTNSFLTPLNIRKRSIKYGCYVPEYDIDILDHLKIVDYGDVKIPFRCEPKKACKAVGAKIKEILAAGVVPIVIGGTEDGTSLPLVEQLSAFSNKGVGCITLDAHGDNIDQHAEGKINGATWIARMAELEKVMMKKHVHIGMRGPRNFKEQFQWFKMKGTTLFGPREIKAEGMDAISERTIQIVSNDTDAIFMSIDYDVLDIGCSPGLDEPMGISVSDLLTLVFKAGKSGISGFSVGWVPTQEQTLHWIVIWSIIYLMAGIAIRK